MSELLYDPETGLMTPFHFYESAKRVRSWADRREQPLALIAISLAGKEDDVKVACARSLLSELRGGDLLCRMGDENFVLLMLGDAEAAGHLQFRLANQIRPRLEFRTRELVRDENLVSALAELGV